MSFIIVPRSRLASLARAFLFGEGKLEGGESFIDAWHGNSRFPPANRRQSATPRSRLRFLSSTRRRIPPVKITELGRVFPLGEKSTNPPSAQDRRGHNGRVPYVSADVRENERHPFRNKIPGGVRSTRNNGSALKKRAARRPGGTARGRARETGFGKYEYVHGDSVNF